MLKLNLGCGSKVFEGWINVDKFSYFPVDLVHDLEEFPYPFDDDSCDEIMMNHVLEHLGQDPDVFNKIISELYRICKNEASIQINVPHPRHDNFLSDPTHVRPINANVLSLYDKQLNEDWEQRNIANTPLGLILDVDFFVESVELEVDDVYKKKLANGEITEQELWSKISECNNICSEIRIKWRCRKPELGEESSKN